MTKTLSSAIIISFLMTLGSFGFASTCHLELAEISNKAHPARLQRKQIERVVLAVRKTFSVLKDDPEILSGFWKEKNRKSYINSTGFSFEASNAVFHMLGGKNAGLTPFEAKYFNNETEKWESHWFLKDIKGIIIDPTADQFTVYGDMPPYRMGRDSGVNFPLKQPSNGALKIIALASEILKRQGYTLSGK